MVRTQIQLTVGQARDLRQLSSRSGRSMADLIREGVEVVLAAQHRPSRREKTAQALRAVGRFRSGSSDVSRNHDRYLAEAFDG